MLQEEANGRKSWLILALIPVCVAATVFITKWALAPGSGAGSANTEEYSEASGGNKSGGLRPVFNNAPIVSGFNGAAVNAERSASAPAYGPESSVLGAAAPEPSPAGRGRAPDVSRGGLVAAIGRVLNSPGAVSAIMNNDFVVKAFMSRRLIRTSLGSKAALQKFLKDPKYMREFLTNPVVQKAYNDQQLFEIIATSKLAGAILDSPGAVELMKDPQALAEMVASDPEKLKIMMDPKVLGALSRNPKTAGALAKTGFAQ